MDYTDIEAEKESPFPDATTLPPPRPLPPELANLHGSDLLRAGIRSDIQKQKNLGQLPRLKLSPGA